jgi:hypothetical protein
VGAGGFIVERIGCSVLILRQDDANANCSREQSDSGGKSCCEEESPVRLFGNGGTWDVIQESGWPDGNSSGGRGLRLCPLRRLRSLRSFKTNSSADDELDAEEDR